MSVKSCYDVQMLYANYQVLGRDYKISQEMRPMDLAPLFDDVWTGSQVGRVI